MMKKAVKQFMACCLAVGITFGSFGTVALADNNRSMTLAGLSETNTVVSSSSTLVGLSETDAVVSTEGAQSAAADTDVSDEAAEASESVDTTTDAAAETADTDAAADAEAVSAETEAQTETEAVYDTSMSGELAFAQCENYINVRAEASVDGEVVGKVYNNGSVTILGQLGDWYEVQSGNVTGYVNAAYFATGEEADTIAEAVAYNVATVNAEGLWVHSEASEDSSTIGMVYSSDQLEVVAYEGDWMKVVLEDGTYGYINAWYVNYDTYYSTAETLEEEQERLDAQWLAYLAEQEAEAAAAEAAAEAAAAEAAAAEAAAAETEAYTYTETYTDSSSASSSSSSSLSEAQAAVDEAYQTYLEAQEAADAATQQADEQLVYDTYDEAVAAYQEYLSAVAVADELKYSTTTDTSAAADTSASETTYTEAAASTETTYTEAAQTEAAQTEAVQTEAAQTEAAQTASTEASTTTTSTSSSSSTGQAIANYAVQFVGNPYVYGGTSLTNGADCSGFTQSVFANFGISIPRTAAAQASSGTSVSLSDIQAGDLLFYSDGSGISHVALYIGNGQVVHASTSSTGIIISSYNYRTPVCARRYW
ncbi:MAG: NlpC/P60 family protein [Lachnospiraceae bacterium]|nr:NlpC/P60 family protein [Lachnospiraceae bacterium]